MPNFSVKEDAVHMPVWVENPTDRHLTWRYDSEYTTFTPGFFRNQETGELWPMAFSIAIHFQKSLPELKIHTTKPVLESKKAVNVDELQEKPISSMTMQELRAYGKSKGKTFPVGVTKGVIIAELQDLSSDTAE